MVILGMEYEMNEKIKQLADKARFVDLPEYPSQDQVFERFAQLIVLECCEVAHCNFHVDGVTLGTMLKQHFGME
jgi:hypothetical protein